MKYMGSKRWMLRNGLGDILASSINNSTRFIDLFSGSGAVAIHVARNFRVQVLAFDLQQYSAILAGAIIQREKPLVWEDIWAIWHERAFKYLVPTGRPI